MVDTAKQGRLQGVPRYVTNATPNPAAALSTNIQVGTLGSADERGLDAFRSAVTTHVSGANAGFLRSGSSFGLLFLSDEEDYGTSPVSDYVTLFLGLRSSAANRTMHAIVGPEPAGCTGSVTVADAGTRYLTMADGVEGQSTSICESQTAFDQALLSFAGRASGRPKTLLLQSAPSTTPTVTSISAGGTRTVLTSPAGFAWTTGSRFLTLVTRPSGGSIEVRYDAACPTTGGGDTGLPWPF
jgi:hypothetical protein